MPPAPWSSTSGGTRRTDWTIAATSARAAMTAVCRSRSRRLRPSSAAASMLQNTAWPASPKIADAVSAAIAPPRASSSSAAGRAVRQSATAPITCSITRVRPSSCTGQLSGWSSAASTALPSSVASALAETTTLAGGTRQPPRRSVSSAGAVTSSHQTATAETTPIASDVDAVSSAKSGR